MRTAHLARLVEECGLCGRQIPIGSSYVVVSRSGFHWKKIRCEDCAGPEPVITAPALAMGTLQSSRILKIVQKFDPKLRQVGEE